MKRFILFALTIAVTLTAVPALGTSAKSSIPVSGISYGEDSGKSTPDTGFVPSKKPKETKPKATKGVPKNTANVLSKKEENFDTVAWLNVPDTNVDVPILYRNEPTNSYYLRRNFNGDYEFNGTFYADYRSNFGNGLRDKLVRNTVIYGHSFKDNPNGEQFSQIKKYANQEFAKNHPYVFFSTEKEDMAFEVFAVFQAHVNFPYVQSVPTQGYTVKTLNEAIRGSSLYNYKGVDVKSTDKILTLSTCSYTVEGKPYQPDTTEYRFVVMGRLVPAGEVLKKTADITANSNPTHPDTYKKVRSEAKK